MERIRVFKETVLTRLVVTQGFSMPPAQTVFLIQIDLKKNIEECPDLVQIIRQTLVISAFDAKDGEKRLSYVKTTTGTAKSVLQRYGKVASHPDVLFMRVLTTSPNYSSTNSIQDPICSKLDPAYRRDSERRKSKYAPNANTLFVNKKKRTGRKSVIRGYRRGKAASNLDK